MAWKGRITRPKQAILRMMHDNLGHKLRTDAVQSLMVTYGYNSLGITTVRIHLNDLAELGYVVKGVGHNNADLWWAGPMIDHWLDQQEASV